MSHDKSQPLSPLGRIGVIASSGRAYFSIVSELKRRGVEHVPLLSGQSIPLDVRVIIVADGGGLSVQGRRIIAFEEGSDPKKVVEDAVLLLQGKEKPEELVLGIDPGKQTGLAVLVDGAVVETRIYVEAEEVVQEVARVLSAYGSERSVVRIGKGAEEYSGLLIKLLRSKLPVETEIEVVEEAGTTVDTIPARWERLSKNIVSAIRIALRQGQRLERGQ